MPELADCLADFIATLGLDRPHVVGRSLGATLAIQLYDRHSAIPRGLVLAGAYAGRAGSLAPDVVEQRLRRLLEEMERPPSEWVPSYVPGLLTEAAPGDGRPRHSLMCDVRAGGNRVMLHATAEADLREVLPRIAVPTLLLHGDADARSPLHVADVLHQQIPTSTVAVIPGVGHLGNTEAASRFNTRSEPSCASTRSCHCPDSTLGKGVQRGHRSGATECRTRPSICAGRVEEGQGRGRRIWRTPVLVLASSAILFTVSTFTVGQLLGGDEAPTPPAPRTPPGRPARSRLTRTATSDVGAEVRNGKT